MYFISDMPVAARSNILAGRRSLGLFQQMGITQSEPGPQPSEQIVKLYIRS